MAYFSHDSDARNDDKVVRLRMKHGAAGYGLYFMLLERMCGTKDYMCVKDYNVIAFDLRVDAGMVKSVVEDFGLFAFAENENGECFYSESFLRRMKNKDDAIKAKSENAQKAANARWNKVLEDSNLMQTQCERNADAMQPQCHIKLNKIKLKNNSLSYSLPLGREQEESVGPCPTEREGNFFEEFLSSALSDATEVARLSSQLNISEDVFRILAGEVVNEWAFEAGDEGKPDRRKYNRRYLLSRVRIKAKAIMSDGRLQADMQNRLQREQLKAEKAAEDAEREAHAANSVSFQEFCRRQGIPADATTQDIINNLNANNQ